MNTHFNMKSFQTVQIHSPSWFIQKLDVERVKNANGSKCFYKGSLCLLQSRRYGDALEVLKREYVCEFFSVNPMDCLRVIFAANYYGRIRRGIKL